MSDPVAPETEVPTKQAPESPETPGKVGGVPAAAPESPQLVGTPIETQVEEKVDPKAETRVLPAPAVRIQDGERKPKANCKWCFGRGYEGSYPINDPATGRQGIGKLICRCMKKEKKAK